MESIRQPNAEKMQLEILTHLNYPTGGYTLFEYEPHSYSKVMHQFPFEVRLVNSPNDSIAGGLRVKQITDVDNTGMSEIRVFAYDGKDGRSSGILSGCPKYHASGSGFGTYYFDPNSLAAKEWNYVKIEMHGSYIYESERPLASLSQTNGNHVTYSQVTESIPGNGKTIFRYSNHEDGLSQDVSPHMNQNFNDLMFNAPFNSRQLFRGHLLSKSVFDKNDRKIRKEEYTYHLDTLSAIKSAGVNYACGGFLERVSYVRIYSDYPYLEQAQVWTYPDDGGNPPSVEITDYSYNRHRQITRIARSNISISEEIRMSYSGDMPKYKSPYGEMQAKGIFDRPVERTVIRGKSVISSSLITYRKSGEMFVPDEYYESRLSSPRPSHHPNEWAPYNGEFTEMQQSIYGAPRMTFDSYDSYGNILSATDEGGRTSRYYWDPSGVNPEASFTGKLSSGQPVQVEDTASEEVLFNRKREYTFKFDADYTGDFSFVMEWLDGDYDILGYMDGKSVFVYERGSSTGNAPRNTHGINSDLDLPNTELYRGTVSAGHHVFRVVRLLKPLADSNGGRLIVSLKARVS
jgi:hypothetical protein